MRSHLWPCSVLIILTNQSLLLYGWKYFGSFDLLIWVDYIPEVTRKHNNKMTYIIFKKYCIAFKIHNLICLIEIMTQYANYMVHLNTISYGELSDPLCDSVNRGLTLVRLHCPQGHLSLVIINITIY